VHVRRRAATVAPNATQLLSLPEIVLDGESPY
jgi:hypothetical protein